MDISQIDTAGKLIQNYGVGIISTVIVGYIVVWVLQAAKRIGELWLDKLDGRKSVDDIAKLNAQDVQVNAEINKILYAIQQKVDADRVSIMQYHNGRYYNTGMHKLFVSMTHEIVKEWVEHAFQLFQAVPSAIFQPSNSRLLKGENVTNIPDTSLVYDEQGDTQTADTYKRIGYKSVYAFAIRREGYLVGKVVVGFLFRKNQLTPEEIESIAFKAAKIEGLFQITKGRDQDQNLLQ